VEITGHPDLLVGLDLRDDSAVYRLRDDLAIVQSLDFFTPIVDDPFTFGQVAAANALSDIFAMGGTPLTALNIVGFPVETMDKSILRQILRGGVQKVEEAGATLVGGHSIKDDELKYGLSVTGTVHPDRMLSNQGALPGDRLLLTKALGTGIIATALKRKQATDADVSAMVQRMIGLNAAGGRLAWQYGVHAMTDVTGFGLAGHLLEMLDASRVAATLHTAVLPIIPSADKWVGAGMLPGGLRSNRKFYENRVHFAADIPADLQWLCFDPQTSGGLLMSVPEERADDLLAALLAAGDQDAAIIGRIDEARDGAAIRFTV